MVFAVAVGHEIVRALSFAGGMAWEILWALILGFTLSGVVQAVVSKREMRRLMPDHSPKTVLVSTGLGAASSSCSYASVALARSLFRRGADFTAAMVFEFASTNLVFELGIVMVLLLGWQFVVGEFVGGPLMIVLLVVLFRVFLTRQRVDQARAEAAKGRLGEMEGHAEMDMSADAKGSWWQRLRTPQGFTATADYFVMDWAAVWRDIAAGMLIAGALAAWVPHSFWQGLFLAHHPTLAKLWGPLIAPAVAIISFVCSVGNVPLAAVLWKRRYQLRRRPHLHLRRPDHPAHPPHLQEVLRLEDGRLPPRHLLHHHGRRRPGRRVPLPRTRHRANHPRRQSHASQRQLELQHHPQHHLSHARGNAHLALLRTRWRPQDASHDEQADGSRPSSS